MWAGVSSGCPLRFLLPHEYQENQRSSPLPAPLPPGSLAPTDPPSLAEISSEKILFRLYSPHEGQAAILFQAVIPGGSAELVPGLISNIFCSGAIRLHDGTVAERLKSMATKDTTAGSSSIAATAVTAYISVATAAPQQQQQQLMMSS